MYTLIKAFAKNFFKHRSTNLLSVGGLSLGTAIALLLGWWAINETKFDNFHKDQQKIYRICREGFLNNETVRIGSLFGPMGREVKDQFPQIEESVRIKIVEKERFQLGEITTYENGIYFADSNFFQFFDFPIKSGDPNTCFSAPDQIVLTESFATKYFGSKDPMGEIVNVHNQDWQVSAVMYDVPANSHLQFDALCAISGVPGMDQNGWGTGSGYGTYVKVADQTDLDELGELLTGYAREEYPPYTQINIHHFLQPLEDIHFETELFRFDYAQKSDKRFVMIFLFMALAILVIACINFTNLFISTSLLRARSIGLKKACGASRGSLIRGFFIETLIYVLVSMAAGIVLAVLILPLFNQLANANLDFDFSSPYLYLFFLGIMIISTLMAGSFPALYLTKLDPVNSMKGAFHGKKISIFQKGLVVLQFLASIVLIITVVVIKKQVHYVQSADLGFNKSNVVYVDAKGAFSSSYDNIKQELERNPSIVEVTAKNCIPSDWNSDRPISTHETGENPYICELCFIKENYLDVMGMELVMGENISKYHDSLNYIMINESAVSALKLDNPIDQQIIMGREGFTVKGVIRNIKSKSLHIEVDPQVYLKLNNVGDRDVIMIRIAEDAQSAIAALDKKWKEVNPALPFEYHFLDQTYDGLYQNEIRAGRIVGWGMYIALFITFIGLLAMAKYSTERRTKEIGLRKVNGAEVVDILLLLNKDFIKWVTIAIVIAVPLSWYLVSDWLNSFAFRTSLSWWIFAFAGLIAIFISLATVSWQSLLTAKRNPVESLRYE